MKNIFKLMLLLVITLNFTACEEKEKKYVTAEEMEELHNKAVKNGLYDKKKNPYTDINPPKQHNDELREMRIFNFYTSAVQHGNTEAGTEIGLSYYEKLKDYEKAIEWFEYSNSIKPTGFNSDSACTVFSQKQDYKSAIKWCKQAVELSYDESITGLGTVYARDGDYENALYWLKKGVELNQAKSSTNLGYVYKKLGNLEEAEKYYLKAIKDYPKDIRNVSNIIHFYHDDLKDNVRASAWAIAGVNNVFLANSVADLLVGEWEIPLKDIQKGYELQLTSSEFPYKYEEKERKLGMIHKKNYDERIANYRKEKQQNNQNER